MTEREFSEQADAVFQRIEQVLDNCAADIDYDSNGSVLEMEFADGGKLIVNRHVANREIWLAAKSGGFHYAMQDGRWRSQRDGSELYAKLEELVEMGAGERISFQMSAR